MRVRFVDNFDFRPPERRGCTIAFKAGWAGTVRRCCGEAAIKQGKAVEIEHARRPAS